MRGFPLFWNSWEHSCVTLAKIHRIAAQLPSLGNPCLDGTVLASGQVIRILGMMRCPTSFRFVARDGW